LQSTWRSPRNFSLRHARARGLDLSRVLEQRLVEWTGVPPRDPFAEENAEAIAAYNARIRADGSFSDDLRAFADRAR
jgi:antitoxin CcdA